VRVGQFKHGCDLNQTFVQKLQLREALDFSAYRKKSRIRTPSAREVFAQSQDPYVRVAENNYRLAQTADPVSRRACCVWCTRYLDQPTVQGSDHLCFLGVPIVHGGNRDDMVRLSRSVVLYWTKQIFRGKLFDSAPRTF